MTIALTNAEFANRMRERRGVAPTSPRAFLVLVWVFGDTPPSWSGVEIDFGFARMVRCTEDGEILDGPFGSAHVDLVHVVEIVRSESTTPPNMWHVTFQPGKIPKGWA